MYFQSAVIPVKIENKQAFTDMSQRMALVFAKHGATRSVACWGDALMDGKITDFKKAVQADDTETVVLTSDWWPDKATYDAAMVKIMADDAMRPNGAMPFDGRRLIYGGFEACVDTGGMQAFGYVDGMVASVRDGDRQTFIDHAAKISKLFLENGATRLVDGWGVDVPSGIVTDFKRAVQAKDGETVIVSWIEWPDKSTRDRRLGTILQDHRMHETQPAWNGQLAIFGGFTPIHDTADA